MKSRTETDKVLLLRLVVGTVQQSENESDEAVEAIIRKIIRNNSETIDVLDNQIKSQGIQKAIDSIVYHTAHNDNTIDIMLKIQSLKNENEFLTSFLPKVLSLDDVIYIIQNEKLDVLGAKNVGAAVGLVMKQIKSFGKNVQGNTVKEAVIKVRGE
jgi:uncharacterized protein YqeY